MTTLMRVERFLWAALLLAVPVSASPFMPLGAGTLVRPLAILPASLLLALAAFRVVFLRQWPVIGRGRADVLLAGFVVYTMITGFACIAFLPEEPFKGQTPFDSFIRAQITLAAGIAFYVLARLYIRSADDIHRTIRLLFLGMSASIGLALIQVLAIVAQGSFFRITQQVTDVFAVHYDGLVSRAQGMTFEPSWLATQIIVLLVPSLIAYSVSREDFAGARLVARHRFMLALGFLVVIGGLLCAGSRFGLACLIGLLLLSGILAIRRGNLVAPLAFAALLVSGGAGLAMMSQIGAGAGAAYVLGPFRYLTNSASLDLSDGRSANDVSDIMAMAGRASAAEAAYFIWREHPVFGVSLGNGYRYFGRYAPDWVYATQLFKGAKEGVGWLDPDSPEKGNAKSLFLRLLSETGVIGLALFCAFLFLQMFEGPSVGGFHAAFRLTTAIALCLAFINQDSFADPVFWIPLALCSAMGRRPRPRSGDAPAASPQGNMGIPQSV